jgi:hypothetical protein
MHPPKVLLLDYRNDPFTPTPERPPGKAFAKWRAIALVTSLTSASRRLTRRWILPVESEMRRAWIEVYLGDRWYPFDPRNNAPRIGRILIARGRDAADVPLTHTFGSSTLSEFRVWADEVPPE